MSKDRLDERLRDLHLPPAIEARERAVLEARAEIARREPMPARGEGRRRALALGAAALLAIIVLLTPPGRAASAWVGDLVGIGDVGGEPTLRDRTFAEQGTAVVVDNGTAPDGTRYEWVAYKCAVDLREEGSDTRFHGIGIAFEWPDVDRGEGAGACEELEGRPRQREHSIGSHGVSILPSESRGVEAPDLVVSGTTGAGIHDLKVFHQEPDGTKHELPVDFARVEGKLRELAHRPEPVGTFVAFLDGEIAAREEIEQRLDLRALLDTGKLRLGPVARRERELAQSALERCEPLEPAPSEVAAADGRHEIQRLFRALTECHEREMPPSPFVYVAYDENGREVERISEPLVTATIQRPGDVEPFGRERPGDERVSFTEVTQTSKRPVEIMSGRAPEGTLYEVDVTSLRGAPGPCVHVFWPYVEDATSRGECDEFPPPDMATYKHQDGLAARPWGFLGWEPAATAHYMLSGFARPDVSRVRLLYEAKGGRRRDAPVQLVHVGAELVRRIGARRPTGYWLAFLPRSVGERPTVEVIAYGEDGKILSTVRYRA